MIKKVMEDYKVLLRSIPAATVSLFFVSVIIMNLLANKELISLPYLALDCGFVVSWVSFLCQDMICKRFGRGGRLGVERAGHEIDAVRVHGRGEHERDLG